MSRELSWIGKTVCIGGVELRVTAPTGRCVMTTSAQTDLPFDPEDPALHRAGSGRGLRRVCGGAAARAGFARRSRHVALKHKSQTPLALSKAHARRIWLRAQRLDEPAPFGEGPEATRAAVEHLGYVQIDTIHVVERCHHQILYTRIPAYQREHLRQAQAVDKTVFEYWTHALSYVPTRDMRFFIGAMKRRLAGTQRLVARGEGRGRAPRAGAHPQARRAHHPRHRR